MSGNANHGDLLNFENQTPNQKTPLQHNKQAYDNLLDLAEYESGDDHSG